MTILLNQRFSQTQRNIADAPILYDPNFNFRLVQIDHGKCQGRTLLSSSLFVEITNHDSLVSCYTTFWYLDSPITCYSRDCLRSLWLLKPEHEFGPHATLQTEYDCADVEKTPIPAYLAARFPLLYKSLFLGQEIHSLSFGFPEQRAEEFFFHSVINTELPLDVYYNLMTAPMGAFKSTWEIGQPVKKLVDRSFMRDFYTEEAFAQKANATIATIAGLATMSFLEHPTAGKIMDIDCVLTQDRFLVSRFSAQVGSTFSDWHGVDLMTLPLYVAKKTWGGVSSPEQDPW